MVSLLYILDIYISKRPAMDWQNFVRLWLGEVHKWHYLMMVRYGGKRVEYYFIICKIGCMYQYVTWKEICYKWEYKRIE